MSAQEMTPCEKLGYRIGDRFEVVTDESTFANGSIIELIWDDRTPRPRFELVEGLCYFSGNTAYIGLDSIIPMPRPAAVPATFMTLPTDSEARKGYPMYSGLLQYFPAALAGVASHSKKGNDKHNPGEPLHHARGKSMDHEDCIVRHLTDLSDFIARVERGDTEHVFTNTCIIEEANALCWRALALSQRLHEEYAGAPMAPGAK